LFNYNSHLSSTFESVNLYDKFDYSKFINLSSNELSHPLLKDLYEGFIEQFDYRLIAKYPFLESYRKFFADIHGIETNQIAFSAGSDIAIHLLIRIFAKSGRAILQSPNYRAYEDSLLLNQICYIKEEFQATNFVENLIQKISNSQPSIVILTSPDAFFGKLLSADQLFQICDLCASKGHIVIVDETYSAYCNENYNRLLELPNVILLQTLSKFPGMAGLRLCLIKSAPHVNEYIRKSSIEGAISNFTMAYAKYSFSQQTLLDKILAEIKLNRQKMQAHISHALNWKNLDSQTNFCSFLCDSGETAQKFNLFMARNMFKIKTFQNPDSLLNLVRITVPCSENLNNLLEKVDIYARS
jgi:histidinol-phosphate/aromatic aminotransferase/cobyric acid decarboxylase-like protein